MASVGITHGWRVAYLLEIFAMLAFCGGVRFTAPAYEIRVSRMSESKHVTVVGKLTALSDFGRTVFIEYSLSANEFFNVSRSEGWITTTGSSLPDAGNIKMTAHASDATKLDPSDGHVTVNVILTSTVLSCEDSSTNDLCFAMPNNFSISVAENYADAPHPIAYFKPSYPGAGCTAAYFVQGDEVSRKHFTINSTTSVLYMAAADREETATLDATVVCKLSDGRTAKKPVRVSVLDVNDNGPRWPFRPNAVYREEALTIDPDKLKRPLANSPVVNERGDGPMKFTVEDLDSRNEYVVYLRHDEYSQFKLMPHKTLKKTSGAEYIMAELHWGRELVINASTYVDVVFENAKVINSSGSLVNRTATVRILIHFNDTDELGSLPLLPAYEASVWRNASCWSSVLRFDELNHDVLAFSLDFYTEVAALATCRSAFDVTRSHGILYVASPEGLRGCSLNKVGMTVTVKQGNRTRKSSVTITLQSGDSAADDEATAADSCSFAASKDSCETTVGLGAPSGYCTWRQGIRASNKSRDHAAYSTCSPSLASCPNGACDDLERLVTTLCPQDCTETIVGSGYVRSERGVGAFGGSCVCSVIGDSYHGGKCLETAETKCTCSAESNATEDLNLQDEPTSHPVSAMMVCGKDCEAVVIAAAAFVAIIATSLAVWCRLHIVREKAKRAQASYRPWRVDSSVSLPSMVYASSGTTSAASTPLTAISGLADWQHHFLTYYNIPVDMYDQKWELPRECIILEKNLGEGEFGMVMKAKVKTKDSGTWSVAAVKMLKDGATSSEFADLVSEYKLLKEVSHNNVIKLIGAVTRNGPFYVVVEYCEHGSLKSYLHDLRTSGSLVGGNGSTEVTSSSAAELLSFCWQVAKGMQYLAEVKLVHRDLAARNILIAAGKVVKISDFGLTRDVYEADAYEKKSHGRIPVKWMAPESLYHQIYTSKSDVWSFGVVLWEIATLGATPYPGIPPERMYRLLQAGYRMDKPDTCSSKLYTLMRCCWEADPIRRPTFSDLRLQLETMIEERVDYLHLSGAAAVRVCSLSSDDDSCGGGSQPDSPSQALLPPQFTEKSAILEDYLLPGKGVKYPPPLFLKYIELQHHDE